MDALTLTNAAHFCLMWDGSFKQHTQFFIVHNQVVLSFTVRWRREGTEERLDARRITHRRLVNSKHLKQLQIVRRVHLLELRAHAAANPARRRVLV